MPRQVAIIGAGLAGLTLATRLTEAGHPVVVFDKGRGVGGRMSTRRGDADGLRFDHGAQYFTIRDPGFRTLLERPALNGSWAKWEGRFAALAGGKFVPEPRGRGPVCGSAGDERPLPSPR